MIVLFTYSVWYLATKIGRKIFKTGCGIKVHMALGNAVKKKLSSQISSVRHFNLGKVERRGATTQIWYMFRSLIAIRLHYFNRMCTIILLNVHYYQMKKPCNPKIMCLNANTTTKKWNSIKDSSKKSLEAFVIYSRYMWRSPKRPMQTLIIKMHSPRYKLNNE